MAESSSSSPRLIVVVAIFLVVLFSNASNGQTICNVPMSGLMACRPAVTGPSPAPPSPACCSSLGNADFKCFCAYKKSNTLPSFGIDPDLAFQLPQKCKLSQTVTCS